MKKLNNYLIFVIGIVLTAIFTVSAATIYNANQVSYRDGKNVQETLDELFQTIKNNDNMKKVTLSSYDITTYTNKYKDLTRDNFSLEISGYSNFTGNHTESINGGAGRSASMSIGLNYDSTTGTLSMSGSTNLTVYRTDKTSVNVQAYMYIPSSWLKVYETKSINSDPIQKIELSTYDITTYTNKYKDLTRDNFSLEISGYSNFTGNHTESINSGAGRSASMSIGLNYDFMTGTLSMLGSTNLTVYRTDKTSVNVKTYMYIPSSWLKK